MISTVAARNDSASHEVLELRIKRTRGTVLTTGRQSSKLKTLYRVLHPVDRDFLCIASTGYPLCYSFCWPHSCRRSAASMPVLRFEL